jgi:hypothetical protein
MATYHLANFTTKSVGYALSFIDIDAYTLAQHYLHGGRVAQLNNDLNDQVDSFIVRSDSIQMD